MPKEEVHFLLLEAVAAMMLQAKLFNRAIEAISYSLTISEGIEVKVTKDISAVATGMYILF